MVNLEICKRIADILGKKSRFTFHPVDMIQVMNDDADWVEFNPIENKELCEKLKTDFKVNIEHIYRSGNVIGFRGCICNWKGKPEYVRSPQLEHKQKAILLAIINAKEAGIINKEILRAMLIENYTRVASNKIEELMQRHDFVSIGTIGPTSVVLEFKNRTCTASSFGNIKWIDPVVIEDK